MVKTPSESQMRVWVTVEHQIPRVRKNSGVVVGGSDAKQDVVVNGQLLPSSLMTDSDLSVHASRWSKNAKKLFQSRFLVTGSQFFDEFGSTR